jgi:hypothetical protein
MPLPPSPPPPPPSATIALAAAVAKELQEQLLAREDELTRREEALAAQEEKARISEKALAKVSADLDIERAKAKATQKEYIDKMETHTARAKHSLGLDKMLEAHTTHAKHSLELDGKERDLSLCEAALAEAQSQGLNPQYHLKELMEFIKLQRLLQDAEVERVTEARRLMILVRDIFKLLVDLGGGGRHLGAPAGGPLL